MTTLDRYEPKPSRPSTFRFKLPTPNHVDTILEGSKMKHKDRRKDRYPKRS